MPTIPVPEGAKTVEIPDLETVETENRLLVFTLTDDQHTVVDAVQQQLAEALPGKRWILLCGGIRLEALTDEQLGNVGLQRIEGEL